jgi:hypothetical protein
MMRAFHHPSLHSSFATVYSTNNMADQNELSDAEKVRTEPSNVLTEADAAEATGAIGCTTCIYANSPTGRT